MVMSKSIQKLAFDCVGFASKFFVFTRALPKAMSLAPDKNFEQPPCQNLNLLNDFDIRRIFKRRFMSVTSCIYYKDASYDVFLRPLY
jgi:hypothetical protein